MNSNRSIFFYTLFFITTTFFAQKTAILEPQIGKEYNFSKKRQNLWKTFDSLVTDQFPKNKFTQEERNALQDKCADIRYSEACDSFWDIVCGDDWTDEGYNIASYTKSHPTYKFCTVSSVLQAQGKNKYNALSIYDLNYKTAWVEGVKGYGIGETIIFNFHSSHPRINKVIIANGYIKDKTTWHNNSRVKQLKMYLNNKPFAILNLKDVYAEQTFKIPIIGYKIKHYTNKEGKGYSSKYIDSSGKTVMVYNGKNNEFSADTIRFEIISIYKGDKYSDTAITEIYFDGLDVY